MIAIILAGGWQVRFNEFMPGVPKILAPIAGRPFLDYLMADLRRAPIEKYHILAGPLTECQKIFQAAQAYPETVDIVSQWPPLGPSGALRALDAYIEGPVLLCNGDTVVPEIDYGALIEFHRVCGSDSIVNAVCPGIIYTGRSIVPADLIRAMPPDVPVAAWKPTAKKEFQCFAYGRFYDIGTEEGYAEAKAGLPGDFPEVGVK